MRTNLNINTRSQRIVSRHLTSCSWRKMGVTPAVMYAFRVEGCARNSKNLRIPQGDDELINYCPHGPDIRKQNNWPALMKTIAGIEVL